MTPKQLTEAREAAGHTLNNAARLLEVPRQTLRRWELEGLKVPLAVELKDRHDAHDLSAGVIERCVMTALKHHQALKHVLALARETDDRKIPCPLETTTSMSGGELRALRKSLKMSQKEFATHLGLTNDTISRWECGTLPVNVKLLRARLEAKNVGAAERAEDTRAFKVMLTCIDIAAAKGYTLAEFQTATLRARRANLTYQQLETMFTLFPRETATA